MRNKSFGQFLLGCGIAAFVSLPLVGCGSGGDMAPEGPEMGSLEKYLNENPDQMLENSDDEDQDEDADALLLDAPAAASDAE